VQWSVAVTYLRCRVQSSVRVPSLSIKELFKIIPMRMMDSSFLIPKISAKFQQKLKFTGKQQNRVLCHPLGHLGVMYTVHLWLVGKRVVDFLLVLIELLPALTVEAL